MGPTPSELYLWEKTDTKEKRNWVEEMEMCLA